MVSESSGTRRGAARASSKETGTIEGGCNATIIPNWRAATRRTAAAPTRSASNRSKVVGLPPRWMSEHERARLLSRHLLDRMGHLVSDAAEPFVRGIDQRDRAAFRNGTLRDDDNAEVPPLGFAATDLVAHLVDVERDFGNQDDVGRAGDS